MMVKVTLELDKLTLVMSKLSLQMRQGLVWMRILEYYFQWVLKLKQFFIPNDLRTLPERR